MGITVVLTSWVVLGVKSADSQKVLIALSALNLIPVELSLENEYIKPASL